MSTDPTEILAGGSETYDAKNDDYGDSWRMVGEILWKLAGEQPITLETPEDFISIGLFTRRFDKIARAFQGEFVADDMNFEATADAHEDEMVYAAMHAANQYDRDEDSEQLPLVPTVWHDDFNKALKGAVEDIEETFDINRDEDEPTIGIDHRTVVPGSRPTGLEESDG